MTYEQKKQLIEKLVEDLNNYTIEYDKGTPQISDTDWDDLYFKLVELEQETGFLLPNSPTNSIHFETVSKLNKKTHDHDMLSLDKTKDIKDIESFIGQKEYLIMLKLDGLTCSLTYVNGVLTSAETRGNGFVGEDILHNIMVVPSVPKRIPVEKKVVIDGEIICKYSNFENFKNEYKNPRNFAAGSIRQLDNRETAKRKLSFVAWDVIEGVDCDSLSARFDAIKEWGFEVVPNILSYDSAYHAMQMLDELREIDYFRDFPIDGYVFKFDSIEYGKQLGKTTHHFKNAKAFKFEDTIYTSQLQNIEWTIGRSSTLTPVAVFTPIEIEGTKIERASLHNISILNQIFNGKPYKNQIVEIVKRNQIIPQIEKALSIREKDAPVCPDEFQIPEICPYCGCPTMQIDTETSIVLKCTNPQCEGQLVNKLTHYCSKNGMDIKGLSKSTLQKLIDWKWVTCLSDLYTLDKHRIEWEQKSGFGPKSVDKILKAINESKECFFWQFVAAIGIPEIGVNMAKELNKYFDSWKCFRRAVEDSDYHFWGLPGFGIEIDEKIKHFDYTESDALIEQGIVLKQKIETKVEDKTLNDIFIVITGKLTDFKNRAELKAAIEAHGGHVVNTVTPKVRYLINNDTNSTSNKNKKAKELGIEIISDKTFKEKFLTK